MAKKFVVKNAQGNYSKNNRGDWVENIWEAKLFNRKCDASNSAAVIHNNGFAVQVEVRVKEDK
jgi:hypothetical protein